MGVLKLIANELSFHIGKKILVIILLMIAISQTSSVIKKYEDLNNEKINLENAFQQKMIVRLLPNSGFSQAKNANPEKIVKALYEALGEKLYYFNYLSPVSPFLLSKEAKEVSQFSFLNTDNKSDSEFLTIYSLEINERQYKAFDLVIEKGKDFSSEDFDKDTNVVILGSHYEGLYSVGDPLVLGSDLESFFNPKNNGVISQETYTIIGFLPNNQKIFDFTQGRTEELALDNFMIFPTSLKKISRQLEGLEVPVFLYAQGIYAIQHNDFDLLTARETLSRVLHQHECPTYFRLQDDNAIFVTKIKLLEDSLSVEFLKLVMLVFFLLMSLMSSVITQIAARGKYFIIYYLLGATLNQLRISYYVQLLIYYGIGFLMYSLYFSLSHDLLNNEVVEILSDLPNLENYLYMFIIYNIISLIIVFIGFRKMSTIQLSQLIKGEKL